MLAEAVFILFDCAQVGSTRHDVIPDPPALRRSGVDTLGRYLRR